MADLRTGKRFNLNLPIRFSDQVRGKWLTGHTDNLSASGVHITLEAEVEVGSEVDFDMTIPAKVIGAPQDVVVRCHGRVVRNDDGDAEAQYKSGLACVIDTYEFVRAGEE